MAIKIGKMKLNTKKGADMKIKNALEKAGFILIVDDKIAEYTRYIIAEKELNE